MIQVRNFYGGEFHETASYLNSVNPANGKVIGQIPDSDHEDVAKSVEAAKAAFPVWKAKTVQERSAYMLRLADLLEKNLPELARLESQDQGKPIGLTSERDIPRVIHNFRFFATAFLHHLETSNQMIEAGAISYTLREPAGVAGLISPWNFPLYLLSFKIAPCLASGCVCVCKPSEVTSLSAYRLCQLSQEAGFPPGVINMVFGTGPKVGSAITQHPDIPLISFTGSSLVGQLIARDASSLTKKISLELGGKNAAVIFSDADMDAAVQNCIRSSFINQGEVCLATSRIFVQRDSYDKFLEKFVASANDFKVGDPSKVDTKLGALVSKEHHSKVLSYIKLAKETGATFAAGPDVPDDCLNEEMKNGYFVPATVLTNVTDESPLMQEEIFGPVTCVVPFDNEDEVVKRVNSTPYGLCSSVYTTNVSRAHRMAAGIQVGSVWINTWMLRDLNMPFGGVKASGIGREGLQDSLHFFTNSKTVCLKL